MKIDKRKTYLIVLDTETANGIVVDNKTDLSQSLVYDCGWVVCDKQGNIYESRSFVNTDIFLDYKSMMKNAYYAEKIPKYWEDIKTGKRTLTSYWKIWKTLHDDIEKYNVKAISAHNASFDLRALNNTIRYLSKSRFRYFFPKNIEIWDTLKMANQVLGKTKMYTTFCNENGYKTNHKTPRNRMTAEILYRYLTGDNDFEESHTGLEDVLIEMEILLYCLRSHKKMEKRLYPPKKVTNC